MIEKRDGKLIVLGDFDGELPVRVLQNNVLQYFLDATDLVAPQWEEIVADRRVSCEILRDTAPAAVRGPRINYDTMEIATQETFEAALWATAYGIMVLHDSWAEMCIRGERSQGLSNADPDVKDALDLLAYVETLFVRFCPWPESLPSPESYPEEKKHLVEKANNLYVSAAAFSLAHEFGHVCLGHDNVDFRDLLRKACSNPSKLEDDEIALLKQRENDADRYAVRHFLSGIEDDDTKRTVRLFGIIITYLCFLIGTRDCSELDTITHPDLGTRILNVLSNDISDDRLQDCLRGAAILALTYFLERQKISMKGVDLNNSSDALQFCLAHFDSLRTAH